MINKKEQEAEEVLNNLRKGAPQAAIDSEFKAMRKVAHQEAEIGIASFKEIFSDGFIVKFMLVGCIIQLGQQFTGMNALMYFGPTIFKSAGVEPIVFQVIQASVNFFATFPAIYAVDRFGRKPLFLIGAIGMTVCFGIIGAMGVGSLDFPENCYTDEFRSDNRVACAYTKGNSAFQCELNAGALDRSEFFDECPIDATDPLNLVPEFTPEQCACGAEVEEWFQVVMILFTFLFIIFFASGWGPVAWVYCSEIYPNRFRAKIVGITTLSNWVGNAGIAFMTPVLLDTIQFNTFLIFAACNFLLIFYSWWLPETKDIPLEKIVNKFEGKLGKWKNKTLGDVKTIEGL